MLRSASVFGIMVATSTPAFAQRTNENAVASAQDAFGTSVGSERVGLYFPGSARGFSPVQAGNVRINGMYFDYQADLNQRLVSGSNVRVGLTAQGYPFPAADRRGPTFSLRLPGSRRSPAPSAGSVRLGGTPPRGRRAASRHGNARGGPVGVGVNDPGALLWRTSRCAPPD
jgi:iron complex outermembrane receptor protein